MSLFFVAASKPVSVQENTVIIQLVSLLLKAGQCAG